MYSVVLPSCRGSPSLCNYVFGQNGFSGAEEGEHAVSFLLWCLKLTYSLAANFLCRRGDGHAFRHNPRAEDQLHTLANALLAAATSS